MKRQIFAISILLSLFSSLYAEPLLRYSDGFYISTSKLNSLPLRSKKHPKTISTVILKAPSDGYIVVESSGKGCIHTKWKFMELLLQRDSKTVSNNSMGWIGHGGACGMDEVKSYSFRHVERVKAGRSYAYKLVAQRGLKKGTISGNIYIGDLVAIFYPKNRKKYSSTIQKEKILLADGSIKTKHGVKEITFKPQRFLYGKVMGTPSVNIDSNRTEHIIKSNVQRVSMPEDPSTTSVSMWLDMHAEALLNIISRGVNNDRLIKAYESDGKDFSIFEKIDRRSETIRELFTTE